MPGNDALIEEILQRLLTGSPAGAAVSLDEIAEAIGAAPVTYEDVERLIDRLEAAGRQVAAPLVDLTADLGRVISAARSLRSKLGRSARIAEVAAESQLSKAAVIRALRFAKTLG